MRIAMVGASLSIRGGITSVEKLILENCPPQVTIIHLPTFDHGSLAHNTVLYWKSITRLTRYLVCGSIDVVHIHFSDRGSMIRKLIPCLLAWCFRRPFILHSHCAFHREFYAVIPGMVRMAISFVFRQCTTFISLSKNWDEYFSDCLRLRSEQRVVLYNPVLFPRSVPDRSSRATVAFVFLGAIGSRHGINGSPGRKTGQGARRLPGQDKGCFDCIKALALLPDAVRAQSRMLIAGDGDIPAADALVKDLGMEDRIIIYQWLSSQQRDHLLRMADAFLLPSYNEGLPMSMLEAMAFALPVVVTPVGGIPEIVSPGQEGLFVDPGNPAKLAQAMEFLVVDPKARRKMGAVGRRRVEELRIDKYVQRLVSVYNLSIARSREGLCFSDLHSCKITTEPTYRPNTRN